MLSQAVLSWAAHDAQIGGLQRELFVRTLTGLWIGGYVFSMPVGVKSIVM